MATKVGEYLEHDPIKLRFTSPNGPNGAPKTIIKRALNQSVQDIVHSTYSAPVTMLYYEKLDISIVELETKKSMKVVWTGALNKEDVSFAGLLMPVWVRLTNRLFFSYIQGSFPFLLPKTNTIEMLGDQLSKLVTLSEEGSKKIRFFEITNVGRRKPNDFSENTMIGNIDDATDIYAEVGFFLK